MPAIFLLEALLLHAPGVAEFFGIADPEHSVGLVVVLAALCWILGVAACWGMVMLVRNGYRISEALVRTLWHRIVQSCGNARTWVICRFRGWLPRRSEPVHQADSEVRLDNFDFTVLQAVADSGPGRSTSAPELADRFSLRPSQFQKSLGKLSNSNMLTTVIGSTDGFDNYRITDYGTAYLQLLAQR